MKNRYLFLWVVVVSCVGNLSATRALGEQVPRIVHQPNRGEVTGLISGIPFPITGDFNGVRQQRPYWCWAALTQAFAKVKNKDLQQCAIVNQQLGKKNCCNLGPSRKGGPRTCNPYFTSNLRRVNKVLDFAALKAKNADVFKEGRRPVGRLKLTGCGLGAQANKIGCKKLVLTPNQKLQGRLSADELKIHVEAGRPVGLFYQFGDFATGHYVWIAGIYDYNGSGGSPRYIINDPNDQMFHLSYQRVNGGVQVRLMDYNELIAGENVTEFNQNVHAQWIATGVGKNQTDP